MKHCVLNPWPWDKLIKYLITVWNGMKSLISSYNLIIMRMMSPSIWTICLVLMMSDEVVMVPVVREREGSGGVYPAMNTITYSRHRTHWTHSLRTQNKQVTVNKERITPGLSQSEQPAFSPLQIVTSHPATDC